MTDNNASVNVTERVNPFVSFLKAHWTSIVFWGCALVLLFFHLGERSISGSEGRWGCAVREMFVSGDFWHPTVNFESYFDKPLFSYWLIAFCALFNHGQVSELMLRLPSAVSGLMVLWLVRCMAYRLWNSRKVAEVCGWVLLCCYSMIYWGRLGEADMLNLAFSTAAVAWYLRNRLNNTFGCYLVFGVLCAVGGHTKGMSAIAVPVVAVVCDIVLSKTWKRHINWRLLLALLVSLLVYLLPFVLSSIFNSHRGDSGLVLAIHENVERFFRAFDHKGAWYVYFVHLPRLFLPFTPFLVQSICWSVSCWKQLDRSERWVLMCIGAIFLLFSLSESKRVYYILPIMPFCALLTGRYFSDTSLVESPGMNRVRGLLLKIYGMLMVACCILFLILPIVWYVFRTRLLAMPLFQATEPGGVLWAPAASMLMVPFSILGLLLYIVCGRYCHSDYLRTRRFYQVAFCTLCLMCGLLDVVLPYVENNCRTEKRFFIETRQELDKLQKDGSQICFGTYTYIDAAYYLNYAKPIRVCSRESDLKEFINNTSGAVVMLQRRHFDILQDKELKEGLKKAVWRREPIRPWDRKKQLHKKIDVYRFEEKKR